uniref:Tetraspanin 8 n=1 Tax=Chelonoidis abingdonii TaxID=106734 RepID=A0A8C0H1M0_CHEAB
MAGVSSCMKYSMFIFNVLFWMCGCIILGVSIWMRVSKAAQEDLNLDSSLFSAVDLMIAVGSIIMVLGFLGCCGAMKESQCMLILFFIGLLLILILQVVAGILGAVYKSQSEIDLCDLFSVTILPFHPSISPLLQNQCCGLVKGSEDWGSNFNSPYGNFKICECAEKDQNTDLCIFYSNRYIYKKPCSVVVIDFFKHHMVILMGIAFGLAFIEIVGLGFSMSLYCQIQRK